jgi:hypothetical protein
MQKERYHMKKVKSIYLAIIGILGLFAILIGCSLFGSDNSFPSPATGGPVNLGSAGYFVILAKNAVTNTGTSAITGNIGLSPAAASFITGFALTAPPTTFTTSALVTGKVYAADYDPPTPVKMTTAISDMQTAYTTTAGLTAPAAVTELGAGEIGGMTLAPGRYKWSSGLSISTNVTLSGAGDYIFQIAQGLTVAATAHVILASGATAANIVWQVGSAATLGTTSHLEGTLMTYTAITLGTGATVNGRLFAQSAVNLASNIVVAQ